MSKFVVASGLPPVPPPIFDASAHAASDFEPHLKREAARKVLVSGLPPKPPTGLPAGWTEEQWAHYGWSYLDAQ